MIRVLLTVVLPLLLPTVLYFAWAVAVGRGIAPPLGRSNPWPWLVVAGVGLMAVVLVAFVQTGGGSGGTYVPPHLENGVVVPGHMVP